MKNNKSKLLLITLFIIVGILIVSGCIWFFFTNKNKKEIEPTVKELPLKIDSTPLNFNIAQTEHGPVLEATFTNNSKEDISRLSISAKLKDTGEVIELKCESMVEKGKTSPVFTGKAPASGKVDDVEVLKYKLSLRSGTYMEYDTQLKQYNWS